MHGFGGIIKRVFRGYFALVGALVPLALFLLLGREAISELRDRVPVLNGSRAIAAQLTWDEVRPSLPAWQPRSMTASAPSPGSIRIGQRRFDTLTEAASHLQPGDTLDIGSGIYREAMVIEAPAVTIRGHGHVILENATAEGKAGLVIRGDGVEIRNLECRKIAVRDGNGACIRLEAENLFVEQVYCHDSQQGILTVSQPGLVHIRHSRFERLGAGGRAHGIYIGGGKLLIEDSLFLASKDQGHEIKSRATATRIVGSVIASLSGKDSRLIDIPNGGALLIEHCLLEQGPNTVNGTAIGFALENSQGDQDHIRIQNSLILLERHGQNRLLHLGNPKTRIDISNNLIVAREKTGYEAGNLYFKTRKSAGIPPYPDLPISHFLPGVADPAISAHAR
jgi:hypothetical protein